MRIQPSLKPILLANKLRFIFDKSIGLKYFKISNFRNLEKFMNKKINGNYFVELICNDKHLENLPRPKLEEISFGKK